MILEKIIAEKRKEVERNKEMIPLKELIKNSSSYTGRLRSFKEAISIPGRINLIAEIKKSSPSKGLLRKDFDPVKIARAYWKSGASALSVLTEKEFFQGDISYLNIVKEAINLPILRKDFIIDEYQIYESICFGADSILLIVQLLSNEQLKEFSRLSAQLNLDVLYEVHNEEDLDRVLFHKADIIGINNRNLKTFSEDLQVTDRLIKKIPKGKVVVSESAVKSSEDIKFLKGLGVNAVLIGETFMRSDDIEAKIKEIMGY